MKKNEGILYSAVGLIALAAILVAFNYLASTAAGKLDLTEGKLYTLSDGTKKILAGLASPVKLKLYLSPAESVPVPLRGFARRVEDMVGEFQSAAGGKLVIERYRPAPDSEEEDTAQIDGIEPQQLGNGEAFYLGIAVSQLDRKQAIPAVAPQREPLLEYDLARAIARVGSASRPRIGLMAGLPVAGARFNPMTRQPAEPWVIANELKREFDVREVPLSADEIPKDIDVLLLIHPRDALPAAEYVLDQFVMRGGKLVAFVDPYAFFDQGPAMPGLPPAGTASSLPLLFKAWGIDMDAGKVVSDVVYGSGGGRRYTPTVLTLNRTALDRSDVVTSQLESMLYVFGGGFQVKPAAGLKAQVLARSSPESMLVDAVNATKSGDEATREFKPGGNPFALAVRLSGRFPSAFAAGAPKEMAEAAKGGKALAPHLAQAAKETTVVLVADVDMLADGAAVDVQEVFGQKIMVPSNGNLAFALGLVEQLSSGDELISLRSRAAAFRPLTVMRELEAEAQKAYFGKLRTLEEEKQKATERLQALQKATGGKAGQILTAEQQEELARFRARAVAINKELKEVRRSLRQDAEAVAFWTKLANIAIMPLFVMLIGIGVAVLRRRRAAVAAQAKAVAA